MRRFHSGDAIDRSETTKLPPIPEVVWQQHQKTQLIDIHNNLTTKIKRKNDVEAQTLSIKETSPQAFGSDSESPLEKQTRSTPVQCHNDSKKQQHEIQRNQTNMSTYEIGDDNFSPPKITTSQIEKQLLRDNITDELCMPLSSTIFLKRKKEML